MPLKGHYPLPRVFRQVELLSFKQCAKFEDIQLTYCIITNFDMREV